MDMHAGHHPMSSGMDVNITAGALSPSAAMAPMAISASAAAQDHSGERSTSLVVGLYQIS